MKTLLMVPALVAALVSSACLDAVTTVKVNADGSGTIVARMLYTREGQQRLEDLSPLLGGGAGMLPKLTEADAAAAADRFGPGVTFVSATPIKGAEGDGIEATRPSFASRRRRQTSLPRARFSRIRSRSPMRT